MASVSIRSDLDKQAQKEQATKKLQEFAEKSEKTFGIFSMIANLIIAVVGQIIQAI